ncbi:unnamed protein product [Polarella glacialis]|uniref:Pirin n=1 Tax=Polarella glacialis TaxID=89957 RepID=A0A813JI72_POLGL|nr:unnamed protein product [Polarella glacialis]CAE8680680.1 unnamed protein product [Polarella glacialis]
MAESSLKMNGPPRVVKAKSMGPLLRIMGSKGIDGDGTEFEVNDVDPFLLCDFVCMEGTLLPKPPFCAHPHAGTAVASILCEGIPMRAWDNVGGFEKEKLFPGGVYVVCSGRGCVHDEGSDPVNLDKPSSAPFGLPGGDRVAKQFRFFQLWFDAGHIHRDELPFASSQVVQPHQVPMMNGEAMRLRLLLGRYADQCGVDVPPTVLHGALLPLTGQGLLQIPAGSQGFLFVMGRSAHVTVLGGGYDVGVHEELLLPVRDKGYDILIEVKITEGDHSPESVRADDALEVLLGFGPPSGKPFYKLLGYGGALVASSEEKVRALMKEYEQDPRKFGVKADAEAADSSIFGLQGGYKDPLDGKGECQRVNPEEPAPKARFFEVEKGPYEPKGKGKGK